MANAALITTGLEPLTVGSVEKFQLSPWLNGLPWDLTGGSVSLLLLDPGGVLTTLPAVVSGGSASVNWAVTTPAGDWTRAWVITDASGVHQVSQAVFFTVVNSPYAGVGGGPAPAPPSPPPPPPPPPPVTAPLVMQFLGDFPTQQVSHGPFWPTGVDLTPKKFFWEAVVCPTLASQTAYIVSSGHGGGHALLWGFVGASGDLCVLGGNVWTGAASVSYGCDDGLYVGEWGVIAVAWNGANIYTYVNGLLCGITPFTGPRQAQSDSGDGGYLYVGGSDHNNAYMKLAMLRGWEGSVPAFTTSYNRLLAAYGPEWPFGVWSQTDDQAGTPCNFLGDYTTGTWSVPDRSPVGYGPDARRHDGVPYMSHYGSFLGAGAGFRGSPPVKPSYVADQTFPWQSLSVAPVVPQFGVPAPLPVPDFAKIFDSFGRANQTAAFGPSPTNTWMSPGSTEGGSLGPLAYTVTGPNGPSGRYAGIWRGRLVFMSIASPVVAYVANNSPDMDARVSRDLGQFGTGQNVALAFRVQDGANLWQFCSFDPQGSQTLFAVSWVAGTPTFVSFGAPANATWSTLRAVTSGTTLTLYTDDGGSGWVQAGQLTNQTLYQNATGVGMMTSGITGGNDISSADRYKNFTVF